MGIGSTAKRRRTGTDSSANSATPSRAKPTGTGRGRGRPPNAPRDGRERPPPLGECFRKRCGDVLDRLSKKDHYNIFLEPVKTEEVAGYAEIIKRPMDFTTMRTKLANQAYRSLGEFRRDLDLIWSNCLLFNGKEPTNIFSKKAIELRRLTEKLIATTRQHLEKDKENIVKWKEKHRRRKETMQANAAMSAHGFHSASGTGSSPYGGRDPRSNASSSGRDPMDTTSPGFPEEHNGRTPEQNALAEFLRLQYSGTTGLYRKSMDSAPFPQYTNPDGSVVQIPLRKYHPADDNWEVGLSGSVSTMHVDACPTLMCESLPVTSTVNPCAPQPRKQAILVEDYAESLYRFVKDTNTIGTQIVTELLSPELAVKKQQEEILKKGLTLKDLTKMAQTASAAKSATMGKTWDGQAIIHLAESIEKANKRVVSILPKLPQRIPELDGIGGLEQLLGKELAREVDAVPVQVVDFSMPHGVSVATMNEISRLQNAPALGIAQKDLHCIESLRKRVENDAQRPVSEAAAKMNGVAKLTPSQLHDIQLRSLAIKQQLRLEAHRQAAIIEQRRHLPSHQSNDLAALKKTELELVAQNHQRSRAPDMRAGVHPLRHPATQTASQSRESDRLLKARAQQAAVAAVKTASLDFHQRQNAVRASPQVAVGQGQHVINTLPPADKNSVCKNCGTRDTLGWRAGGLGPDGVERLCIPCGLYWEKSNRHRPKELWGQTSQRKSRTPSSGSLTNSMVGPRGAMTAPPTLSPNSIPNGVAQRSIQKQVRTPQSSPNRSPTSLGARINTAKAPIPAATMAFGQGTQSIHPGQALVPGSSRIGGLSGQSVPPGISNAAQRYPGQRRGLDAQNGIAGQTMQSMQGVHAVNTGSLPVGANASVRGGSGVNIPAQVAASMAQMMYRRQQAGGRMITSQQLMPLGGQSQASIVGMGNNTLLHQHAMKQQMGGHGMGIGDGVNLNAYVPPVQQGKNASLVMNVDGGRFNGMQQGALQKNVGPLSEIGSGGIEQVQQGVSPGSGGVGLSGMGGFVNHSVVNSAAGSNFGDVGSRTGVGGDEIGGDQIGDMFFADAGLEGTAGTPDFAF